MRVDRAVVVVLAGLLGTSSHLGSTRADPKPPADEAEAPPPPKLELQLIQKGPNVPWRVLVKNTGEHSARVAADPRLLWFEVKVPGKRQEQTCRLPGSLFPAKVKPRGHTRLRPGESLSYSFDPRLYCFASAGQWRLVPGAVVTPHFGWPQKTRTIWKNGKKTKQPLEKQQAPFVASTSRGGSREAERESEPAASTKEVEGKSFALSSSYAAWAKTRLDKRDGPQRAMEIRMAGGSDAEEERTATIRVTLKNASKESRNIYFRRELLTFEVMGPDGLVTCDAQPDDRAPDRQAFMKLRSGGNVTVTSRLVELCPRGTFGRPGLYLVHSRFDANETGDEYDLDAYTGRVISVMPASVRIHKGEQPFMLKMVRVGSRPGPPAEGDKPKRPAPAQSKDN